MRHKYIRRETACRAEAMKCLGVEQDARSLSVDLDETAERAGVLERLERLINHGMLRRRNERPPAARLFVEHDQTIGVPFHKDQLAQFLLGGLFLQRRDRNILVLHPTKRTGKDRTVR